jgi:AraC-like DNA-binding protein
MVAANFTYPLQRHAPAREWSPRIHYAQLQHMPKGVLVERRLYNFELLYVIQGEAATRMYGNRYTFTAGQLIYLPSGILHQNEVLSSPDARFMGIHFDYFDELDIQTEADMIVNEAIIQTNKFGEEAYTDTFSPLSSLHPVFTPSLNCVQLMEQLVKEFTIRPLGYELVCKGLMLHILTHLLRSPITQSLAHTSQHGLKLKEIMKQIDDDPASLWTNATIAEKLDLSIDYTAKLFKQLSGMPPSEFVQFIRHREARRLLRESDLSIEIIGQQIGYPDIHYFSRVFRRHEGISATEYRKISKIL